MTKTTAPVTGDSEEAVGDEGSKDQMESAGIRAIVEVI